MDPLPLNQILCGDCARLLQGFPSDSVDLVVTDPPYGLSFMGKEWDKALPSREAFTQIHRVLKPGALAFVMSSPRQDLMWRMMRLLEEAGFEMRQSFISWVYKTGMPKAYDISKGIDKKFKEREEYYDFVKYLKDSRIKNNLSVTEVAKHFPSKSGGLTGCVWNWENAKNAPTNEQYDVLKKILNLDNRFDWLIDQESKRWIEAEREKIGEKTWIQGNGVSLELRLGERREVKQDITLPIQENSKYWLGWKSVTGLKPALEPILMVNKPMSEPTIVDNVLRWGTGAINVDACRIPVDDSVDQSPDRTVNRAKRDSSEWGLNKEEEQIGLMVDVDKGRFPANLLVSDGALDTGEMSKSGTLEPNHRIDSQKTKGIYGEYSNQPPEEHSTYGDTGDQSRYFDLDAWAKHRGILDVPKPDAAERDYGLKGVKRTPKSKFNLNDGQLERFDGAKVTPRRNTHPTVKPIKLMAYLIELGCPRGGVVMDPFLGSGTTCIAAKQLGRRYIGIELEENYHALAEARIAAYPQPIEWFGIHFTNEPKDDG